MQCIIRGNPQEKNNAAFCYKEFLLKRKTYINFLKGNNLEENYVTAVFKERLCNTFCKEMLKMKIIQHFLCGYCERSIV